MSKSNEAVSGPDIRLLQEHEISDVNGGSFLRDLGVGLLGGLFVDSALIGYYMADGKLPRAFQEGLH